MLKTFQWKQVFDKLEGLERLTTKALRALRCTKNTVKFSFQINNMKTYLAYFDFLGFKDFIFNNDHDYVAEKFNNLMRDSQTALSGEKYVELADGSIVPDLKNAKVNCMHISDSVMFWTNSVGTSDFLELMRVVHDHTWRPVLFGFPLRGCVVYGDIEFHPFEITGRDGSVFLNYSMIGKALVDAYVKAESQNWAGCFIDNSAIQHFTETADPKLLEDLSPIKYLEKLEYIIKYPVPFKGGVVKENYAIKLTRGALNEEALKNLSESIRQNFAMYNKSIESEDVQLKIQNTIDFLSSFLPKEQIV